MKNIFTSLLLIVILVFPCFSQNAFYDAKRVVRLKNELVTGIYKEQTVDSILAILLKFKDAEDQPFASEGQMTIEAIKNQYKDSAKGVHQVISFILSRQILNRASIPAAINLIEPSHRNYSYVTIVKGLLSEISLYEKHLNNRTAIYKDSTLRVHAPEEGIKRLGLFKGISKEGNFYDNTDLVSEDKVKAEISKLNDSIKTIYTQKLRAIIPISYTEKYNSPTAFLIRSNIESAADNAKIVIEQVTSSKMNIPSQSDMIDAMAIYLANRVKLELTLTFFENLKKEMKGDEALFSLFPNTVKVLTSYSSYEAPNFGAKWKYAFAEDFVSIPDKITEDKDKYFSQRFDGKQEIYSKFLKQAVQLAGAYRQNRNIIDVVEYLKLNVIDKNSIFGAYIDVFSLINNELYSTGKRDYWISYTEFLRMSDEEFEIMLSLLTNRYPSVMAKLNVGTHTSSLTAKEFKNWLGNIMYVINQFQQAQHNLQELQKEGSKSASYWSFASNLFEKMTSEYENGLGNASIKPVLNFNSRDYENIKVYVSIFKQMTNLYSAIQEKNYPFALQQTVELVKEIRQEKAFGSGEYVTVFLSDEKKLNEGDFRDLSKKKQVIIQDAIFADFNRTAHEWTELVHKSNMMSGPERANILIRIKAFEESLNSKVNNYSQLKKVLSDKYLTDKEVFYANLKENLSSLQMKVSEKSYNKFISALTFVTEVTETTDSKELSRIIASYAAPPGSYRIKRNTTSSWDISAYVGLTAGFENKKFAVSSANFAYGLAAPIGFSYSWSTSKPGNAWTASLSIVDIGAVVRYRLEGKQDKSEVNANGLPYKISFAQVVAPALHLHRGIKNTPLTFFAGVQYVPQLRNFEQDRSANVRDYQGVFQLQGGAAFDLPLFHITKR